MNTTGDEWRPSGLELARSVARTLGGLTGIGQRQPRRRRPRSKDSDPASASSGAAPDDRDPQRLGAAIDRLVAEHGWTTDLAVAGALARWQQIVGADVAQHCRAERYADAELTVRADSTTWATQMRLLAPTVVRRLNEELGDGTVARVRVLGPGAPGGSPGRRKVRGGRGPRDTYG